MNDEMGYADADYTDDQQDRKSILGCVLMLNGGIVHCSSRKMHSVARSTTEAEYVGDSEAAKKVIWLRRLVAELKARTAQVAPRRCC